VSERAQRGESLERSYQYAPIGLCYFDTDLRYVYINDWLANINGLTAEQHLGQRIGDILPVVAAGVESQLRLVLETGEPIIRGAAHLETPAHPGSRRHYEHSFYPDKSDDGTVVGLRCVVEDVTEYKRAEEQRHSSERQFRALVEQAPNAIVAIDGTRRIVLVNPAAETLFGYSREDLLGQAIESLLPERLHGKHADHVRSFAADPQARPMGLGRELLARRRDGTEFPVEISLGPIETDQGLLVAATVVDISERVKAEAALNEANAELERRVAERTAELQAVVAEVTALKNRLGVENTYLRHAASGDIKFDDIVGDSEGVKAVLHRARLVASTDSTVLLLGETGTGKDLLARAIHRASPRRDQSLINLNCAALPAELIESELFGHEKGAFTGAFQRKIGRFELADGGTLFLDEIGDLPAGLQVKLLRFLQEGEFERLGATQTQRADVRIIAATNRNLGRAMDEGQFRPDLYYRLSVFPIDLPPLRHRREDIPLLVWFIVGRLQRRLGKRIESIPAEVMAALTAHDWPGNVRELQNVLEHALIMSSGPTLTLDQPLRAPEGGHPPRAVDGNLQDIERAHILRTLDGCSWKIGGRDGAAERLGLKRTTLLSRMKKLQIQRQAQ
jgi:PAS domain S-box-containing protein